MALQKVLAEKCKFEVQDGANWLEIGGLNSFSKSPSKTDSETRLFGSGGWSQHRTTRRGVSYTLEGFWLEAPLVDGKPAAFFLVATGATAAGNVTISEDTIVGGVTVAVAAGDTPWEVATKMALAIKAETGWDAKAAGDKVVMWRDDGTAPSNVAFVDTDTTGVTIGDVFYSGDRDAGQAKVDALAYAVGADAEGAFRVTYESGVTESFTATVDPGDVGGGDTDDTSWGATLVVVGAVTRS